jgi:hypothetical protein
MWRFRRGDREVLASSVRSPSIRAGLAQRARIVLLTGDGIGTNEVVQRTGVSKPSVIFWSSWRSCARSPRLTRAASCTSSATYADLAIMPTCWCDTRSHVLSEYVDWRFG